jgi:hypothetical protein
MEMLKMANPLLVGREGAAGSRGGAKLRSNLMALLSVDGKPYSGKGDLIESSLYDTMLLEDGVLDMRFFQRPIGAQVNLPNGAGGVVAGTKHIGHTNMELAGSMANGQAFAVSDIAFKILSVTILQTTINTNSLGLIPLIGDLSLCHVEGFLTGKQHMGSFIFTDWLPGMLIEPAASAIGVPRYLTLIESARKLRVSWPIPPLLNFMVRLQKADGVNWTTGIKNMVWIQCILKGFLARRT